MHKHPKSGVYYYRKTVPPELRPYLPTPHTGKRELLKSLGTKDAKEASRVQVEVAPLMERLLDHARAAHVRANGTAQAAGNASVPMSNAPWAKAIEAIANEVDDFPLGPLNIASITGALVPSGGTFVEAVSPASGGQTTINQVFDAYLKERTPTPKTGDEFRRSWRLLCDITGLTMDSPIAALTKQHVAAFKREMLDFPARAQTKELRALNTTQLIAHTREQNLPRNSKANVKKHLGGISTVTKYAFANGDIAHDPTHGITIKISRDEVEETKGVSYEKSDLERIFAHPVFTDSEWAHRQWVPVLAYFTGCRGEELAQLLVSDVREEAGIHYISVETRDEQGNLVKALKSYTARRNIPLHPSLISLGFLEFVAHVKGQGNTRLFHGLTPYKGRMFSNFSKWWGHQRDKFKITDRRKKFHSFRHGFKDACHRAFVPDRVQDALMGHANDAMGERYGSGRDLPTLAEWVGKLVFPAMISRLDQKGNT